MSDNVNHIIASNYGVAVICVRENELEAVEGSLHKFGCPVCKKGIIIPQGWLSPGQSISAAYCSLCFQRFQFVDSGSRAAVVARNLVDTMMEENE